MFSISLSDPTRARKARTLLMLALLAASVPVTALAKDDKEKDKKDKYESFAAGAQFSEVLGPSTDSDCQPTKKAPGSTALGEINGVGLATAIGAFTVSSTDCVRSTDPYAFTPPYAFSSTKFVLRAANGDQIVVAYSGTAEQTPSGLFALTGTFSFVSGTGTFKKVKGSGTIAGVENIAAAPAQGFVTLTGQISY